MLDWSRRCGHLCVLAEGFTNSMCSTFLAKGFAEEITPKFTPASVALLFTLVHKPDTSWLSKDASPP